MSLLVASVFVTGVSRADEQPANPLQTTPVLTVIDSGVTPGMVTVPPVVMNYATGRSRTGAVPREVAAIVLATEDRRVRLIDPDGTIIATVRTGERYPVAVLPVGTGILRMLRKDGVDVLIGYFGGHATVVHPVAGGPGIGEGPGRGIEGDPVAIYHDPEENSYILYSSGQIAYRSTGGNTLWSRPLPAPIRGHGSDGTIVYVGLADGRIFAFFPGGRGDLIARVDSAVEDVVIVDDGGGNGRRRFGVLDSNGRVYLLAPRRDRDEWSILWSADLGERYRGTRGRFAEGVARDRLAVYAERGPVTMVDLDGHLLWRREPGGEGVRTAAFIGQQGSGAGDSRLFVVDALGRGHLFSRNGVVESVIHLDGVPDRVVPLDGIDRLFLGYPDWRYDILGFTDESDRDATTIESPTARFGTTSRGDGSAMPQNPGALRRYADAVLSADSYQQRRDLLVTLRSRLVGGRLFGELPVMREVLEELSTEAFSDPVLRGGIVQNNFPSVRREAAVLLGELGDRESRRILARIVRNDPDGTVVSAALSATARSGRDDASAVIYGFERFQRATDRDRISLAEGIVVCLESTVPDQREPVLAERRRIAIALAGADIPRSLRDRAIRVLRDR
jgi:outer membrane protein assembly factor BamB